ncbi:hypothetical protein L6R29_21860 [Myxococcota bacterium]|nr:hypothetical protein [Myxococcota bacterium]
MLKRSHSSSLERMRWGGAEEWSATKACGVVMLSHHDSVLSSEAEEVEGDGRTMWEVAGRGVIRSRNLQWLLTEEFWGPVLGWEVESKRREAEDGSLV